MKMRCILDRILDDISDRRSALVRCSISCLAAILSISMASAAVQADQATVRWAKPKTKGVVVTAQHTIDADTLKDSGVIVQVQHQQALTPPQIPAPAPKPMTDAQRDTIFKELRPQSTTPPAGATLVPSTPSSSMSLPKRDATPSPSSSPSSAAKPRDTYVPKNDAVDAAIDAVVNAADLPKTESVAIEKKDPLIQGQTDLFSNDVPKAPTPFTYVPPKSKEIECPKLSDSKSIRDITFDIRPMPGPLPKECPMSATPYNGRHYARTCYQWKASALCTKAAYFEDVQLERYGHSICPTLQPVISGAKFFLTIPILPYKMGLTTPDECVYTLGHYRAGNCAPYMLDPLPISVRAMLFEGLAVGGAVALIP